MTEASLMVAAQVANLTVGVVRLFQNGILLRSWGQSIRVYKRIAVNVTFLAWLGTTHGSVADAENVLGDQLAIVAHLSQ